MMVAMVYPEPYFSLSGQSRYELVRLGSFQNLYLSFAIVEITHGVTANRDDTRFPPCKASNLYVFEMDMLADHQLRKGFRVLVAVANLCVLFERQVFRAFFLIGLRWKSCPASSVIE